MKKLDQMNMNMKRFARGLATPVLAGFLVLTLGGAAIWLKTMATSPDPSDYIGFSRTDIEAACGKAHFTARNYSLNHRTSVRKGGIKMRHGELRLENVKPRIGLDASYSDRVLIWTDDHRITTYADRCTRGDLAWADIDTGIALDQPGKVYLARLDRNGKIEAVMETRPSFVINLPD